MEKHMLEGLFQIEKSLIPYSLEKLQEKNRRNECLVLERKVAEITSKLERVQIELNILNESKFVFGLLSKEIPMTEESRRLLTTIEPSFEISKYDLEETKKIDVDQITPNKQKVYLHKYCMIEYNFVKKQESLKEIEAELNDKIKKLENYNDITSKKMEFTIACSNGKCKNYLDANFVCSSCNIKFCPNCREQVKPNGNHECDKNVVKSIKMMQKDSKPCPGCKIMIFKIEGCSQMFCTNCNTAFNWDSGLIDKGRIHNPHYFDYLKRNGGLDLRRENQEQLACDDPVVIARTIYGFDIESYNLTLTEEQIREIEFKSGVCISMCRLYNEIHDFIQTTRNEIDPKERFHGIRCWVIKDKLDDKKWKTELYKDYRRHEYQVKCNLLLQMFNDVVLDILRKVQRMIVEIDQKAKDITLSEILNVFDVSQVEIDNLIAYFNEQSSKISNYFNYSHKHNISNYKLNRKAYNSHDLQLTDFQIQNLVAKSYDDYASNKLEDLSSSTDLNQKEKTQQKVFSEYVIKVNQNIELNPAIELNKYELEALSIINKAKFEYRAGFESLIHFFVNDLNHVLEKLSGLISKSKASNKRFEVIDYILSECMSEIKTLFCPKNNENAQQVYTLTIQDYTFIATISWFLFLHVHILVCNRNFYQYVKYNSYNCMNLGDNVSVKHNTTTKVCYPQEALLYSIKLFQNNDVIERFIAYKNISYKQVYAIENCSIPDELFPSYEQVFQKVKDENANGSRRFSINLLAKKIRIHKLKAK
jgi:hypothetical protein